MAALWVAGVGRKSLTVVASGAPRREFWSRLRKEKQPVVAETVEEVKKEPILVCPPLRSQAYIPPKDLQSRLESHVKEVFGSSVPTSWQEISLEDVHMKFSFLARLADDLGHAVPNSRLHQMCRCWRRLLRVPWTAERSNQSILKEISPEYSLEGLMLKLKLQYFGHLCEELTHLKRP
uniref:Large ribosomal subunit protein mL50 n=1 Tax=Bos taurus TaxID=9913 RepID=A0AAA9SVP7_BOVIN